MAASRDRETAELIAARRRTRRLAVLAACLALLLGAAVAAGVLALRQRSEAIANERSARSGQLATLSEAQLPTDPPLSLGLALAAFDVKPAGQAQTALRRAALDDRLIARFQGHRGAIYNVSVSPDGIHAVTAGHDGTVRVWDLRDGTARILRGHRGEVFDASSAGTGAAW
jgi:hypothetical protein